MPGNTPRAALAAYLDPLQRALSCVTSAVITGEQPSSSLTPDEAAGLTFPIVLADGGPVPLQPQPGYRRLGLSVRMRYALVYRSDVPGAERWRVTTADYAYAVHDDQDRELFAYHFHPHGRSEVRRPHIHFRSLAVTRDDLAAAHFLTGRVALEEVLWVLLDDRFNKFRVKARPRRGNWREIVQGSLHDFERWRTWPEPDTEPLPLA